MLDPNDVHPLTDFQRHSKAHLARLHKHKRVTALTVNGRTAAILLDPTAYNRLAALAREAEDIAALRTAFAELKAGRGRSFDRVARDVRSRRAGSKPAPRRRSA
jgi:PHD/YefM family antitoxin component YafN of YafNO toxin-antitoxin module